jgi:hypothetical protein
MMKRRRDLRNYFLIKLLLNWKKVHKREVKQVILKQFEKWVGEGIEAL